MNYNILIIYKELLIYIYIYISFMNNIIYNNLNADSAKIIQDNRITIKLKEHQKTAINAMLIFEQTGKVSFSKPAYIQNYQIYDETHLNHPRYYIADRDEYEKKEQQKYKEMNFEIESNYGILADKVGSGKTFMTMGLIIYKQIPTQRDRIVSSSVYTVTKYKDLELPIKTNLILVPHNLINQWKVAFRFANLKTYSISKNIEIEYLQFRDNIFDNLPAKNDADYNELNCIEYYDTLIISATMFEDFYKKWHDIKWARIFIDEIVSIKLPTNLEFKCNFIWFLTATPSGIRNIRRNYIRSLVSTINDYTINNIIIKNNDTFVDESMNLPNINQIIIKCLTPKELLIIKEYVDDDIINMLNAGNIQDAITKLNCNIETSENILEVITKKIKKELHNKRSELEYENKRIPDDKKIHDEKIKRIQDKIKELVSKCSGIEDRIKSFKEENCPICFDDFDSPMVTPCCNNIFCVKCLSLCKNCPMCRLSLNLSNCTVINDKISEKNIIEPIINKHILCSKADNLITLIKTKPNGKFLVFSNYDRTFENLNIKLTENNIIFNRLIGTPNTINSIIKRFELGEIKILMLNALNYGSGLNLQMASDIIIYHELDIELETQVIGRAQRLGRTESLNVYYLLNDNEKINCKNPTLNLDIYDDDITMLELFIQNNNINTNKINLDIDSEKDNIIDNIIDNDLNESKNDIVKNKTAKVKKTTKKKVNIINENKQINQLYDLTDSEIIKEINAIDYKYMIQNQIEHQIQNINNESESEKKTIKLIKKSLSKTNKTADKLEEKKN
jgi:hypothetical protein